MVSTNGGDSRYGVVDCSAICLYLRPEQYDNGKVEGGASNAREFIAKCAKHLGERKTSELKLLGFLPVVSRVTCCSAISNCLMIGCYDDLPKCP